MADFEFGLLYSFRNPPQWRAPWQQVYDEHIQHIVEMEQAGFDTIWLTEHHFSEDGYLPQLATMTAALAMVTKTVTLGHSIVEQPLHHPVSMAEQIAVADILSHGRVRMGVGLGRMNFEWRDSFRHEGMVFGASLDRKERARMFEEQIEILKKCWAAGPFKHKGEFYDFPEIDVTPKPAQAGGPEIWFGVGDQAKKPLDRAARMGHGWTGGPGGLKNYLDKVKEHGRMAEAGKAVIFMNQLPADDPEAMEAKYGEHLAYIPNWYNPGGELEMSGWNDADAPAAPGWFAEPAEIAKQLDYLRARGATGALWFAPFAGVSALEASPIFAELISKVKPLMA
ncbi:MAG: alkanesulfonate monooxygenase SsuD [Gammaproteobacteria bacterium]|jgi:alkanesulfonate monooxygenase SsuD/methylene tetrahydromethanopterin reductase-like flavin-dependent oxidoreductase (luciferase family)